jgi:hypothetical protein
MGDARIPAMRLGGEEEIASEARVWPFFLQHVASSWGVYHVECHTLAALVATCRAGRAALRQALKTRERAVMAAGHCLYSRIAVDFLVRPTARLDDFIRLALYDEKGVKLAEVKLSRVHVFSPPPPPGDGVLSLNGEAHVSGLRLGYDGMAVALWRCASPHVTGTPRQALAGRMLNYNQARDAVTSLLRAGFRPLRRRGFYNTGTGEPLWARP